MSDRVALIGGNTIGRDHFPFPVPDAGSTGLGTIYPFPLDLETAAAAFYLVRKWKIVIDITVAGMPPSTVAGTYYAEAGAIIENGSVTAPAYIRESDLVIPRLTFSDDDETTSNFALFSSEDDDFFSAGERLAISDGGLFPAFYFTADDAVGTADDFGTGSSGVSLTFMDLPPITLFGSSDHSGTVVVTPEEYWPYATRGGSPVYDATTGAQLADPLS